MRASPILKSCVSRKKKLECYRRLIGIEGEIRTANQYHGILIVGEYLYVVLDEQPRLPND